MQVGIRRSAPYAARVAQNAVKAKVPPHLMTLGDLSVGQLKYILQHAANLKRASYPLLQPVKGGFLPPIPFPSQSLAHKTITLLFSKRSTRTRVSAETATSLLGGNALFLGKEDIQLGVNESIRDSMNVLGGMTQGIFARVGAHTEIQEMAAHSPVPIINALSSLWHPTQILADLLTLHEHSNFFLPVPPLPSSPVPFALPALKPLTITYVGDSANVLHDMLVTFPRLGHKLRVATPPGAAYQCPGEVWKLVKKLDCAKDIVWTSDPLVALKGADVVVTDTWISMGQEAEKVQRLQDFKGFQITEALAAQGGANPDWKFLHCLPRKGDEVDDEVFYGPRSLVFPEAENRKWTIMALFDLYYGKWDIPESS